MGNIAQNSANVFGIGNMQGSHFQAQNGNPALQQMQNQSTILGDRPVQQNLLNYANGLTGLNDTLQAGFNQDSNGYQGQAFRNQLALDPTTASRLATDQISSNPIQSQLFGQGGALSGALGKEQELQNQGFSLKPEDIEAYGQTSGNIARMFGQQEQGLAQSLANRGLAGAGSGAAGAGFSGLMGNKNEQLANAQMNIANQRMQNTMGRIAQQQKFASDLGQQANNALNNQMTQNRSGVTEQNNALNSQAQVNNQYNQGANKANLDETQNQQGREKQTIFDAAHKGVMGGVSSLGSQNASGGGAMGGGMAHGGLVGLSGGGVYSGDIDRQNSIVSMLPMLAMMAAAHGGQVPGRSLFSGDNPKNDVVNARLSPGEIVIPNSVSQSDNPAENSKKYVKSLFSGGKY